MDTFLAVEGGRRRRRHHSAEFKAEVIAACRRPGVSIASVALANGLNANLLRRWVADQECSAAIDKPAAVESPAFVPVRVSQPKPASTEIRVDLRRNELAVSVIWPASASAECAAWLRALLR